MGYFGWRIVQGLKSLGDGGGGESGVKEYRIIDMQIVFPPPQSSGRGGYLFICGTARRPRFILSRGITGELAHRSLYLYRVGVRISPSRPRRSILFAQLLCVTMGTHNPSARITYIRMRCRKPTDTFIHTHSNIDIIIIPLTRSYTVL